MLSNTVVGQRAVVGNSGYTQESPREAFQKSQDQNSSI